jgi:hypothetical protein
MIPIKIREIDNHIINQRHDKQILSINDGVYKPFNGSNYELKKSNLCSCFCYYDKGQKAGYIDTENDDMENVNSLIDGPYPDYNNLNLNGGAVKVSNLRSVFRSGYTMYMIADATDQGLIRAYHDRLDRLGINKRYQVKIKPHISLMQVQINKANPDYQYLVNNV